MKRVMNRYRERQEVTNRHRKRVTDRYREKK